MEKIFRPNKWFVLFCGLLVLVWGAAQFVAGERIKAQAAETAKAIFDFDWRNCKSEATITDVSIVNKSDNDAQVKITGKQKLIVFAPDALGDEKKAETETVNFAALLSLYKISEHNKQQWKLGAVQLTEEQ